MTPIEKAAILISWCVTTAIAAWLADEKWSRTGLVRDALGAGLVFFLIMTWIHWIGYHIYQRQRTEGTFSLVWAHKRALRTTFLQQALFVILAALTVDGGLLFQEAQIAVVAYWLAWSIIASARPAAPTVWDIRSIRMGYLIIFAVVIIAGPWVWWRLGYWPFGGQSGELEFGVFLLVVGFVGFFSRIPSTPITSVSARPSVNPFS
jgi:hypothetical protein